MPEDALIPKSAVVYQTESRSDSTISASTVARYRKAQKAHEEAKESAIRDLTSNANLSAQDATIAMMQIQRLHKQAAECTATISRMCTSEIQESDAQAMRSMRREGATDTQIAEFYGTNQTKINRMINGK